MAEVLLRSGPMGDAKGKLGLRHRWQIGLHFFESTFGAADLFGSRRCLHSCYGSRASKDMKQR